MTADDTRLLLQFYQAGRGKTGTFEDGIERGLQGILSDPEFVFRTEAPPSTLRAGQSYRINDLELASRLAFFLWSTTPDDQLINLASRGQLSNPKVLEAQVRRMLADPRSRELVENFAGQWLQLRNLPSAAPSTQLFPNFDDNLRQAFRIEAEMFFDSILREDRSVARPARPPTTPSSTSVSHATTGCRMSTAAGSAASRSVPTWPSAAGCSAKARSC